MKEAPTSEHFKYKGTFKMNKILIAISLIMFFGTSVAQEVTIDREVRMLALGDSYTIGASVDINGRWPHQLMDKMRSLGASGTYPDYIAATGWTTNNLIQGINSILKDEKKYNLVSILIGVNNQYQGIPVSTFEPDLREIIDLALGVVNQDTSRVLILSIPDYAYTPFGNGNPNISQEIDDYNEIKKKVAEQYRIAFIDITPISRQGFVNPSLVATDGLHPSADQYGQWVETIVSYLRFDESLSNNDHQHMLDEHLWVYPNPALSTIHIETSLEIGRISIFNATGQMVTDLLKTSFPLTVDVSHLGPGTYTLWVYHAKDTAVSRRKIIIQAK